MDQPFRQQPDWMLQLLLDTIPTRVFWKDRESFYLGCNLLFARDAGYSSVEEVVGKTDYDMPWKEQADANRADDRTVMSTGEPKLGYEEPSTTADGRSVCLRKNKVPLKDGDGRIIGVMCIYEDITEHKEAEERLREREALYHTMFEHSPFSVVLNNLSGQFVDINERFVEIVGVPREEAIGRTPVELGIMDTATQAAVLEEIGRTGGRLDSYEIQVRTRSGETRWALISTALVALKDEPLILSIINDITDRRQAEASLRKSEEKYRELVQNANSIILRWGRDGVVHFFNEFAQTFFGYPEEEIVGHSVMGTIVAQTETSGRDLQAMISEITAHPEYHGTNVNENMRKNGERVWIAWTNKPVFDDQGEITEILSVGLDITPRIRDQQALQESEARYRSIFDSNVDAFVLFDPDGKIVDANARASELCGYARGELIGLSGRDIVDPRFAETFTNFAGMGLGEWFRFESVGIRKDGTTFDVEIHGARLHYGSIERLLTIIFDVTERNRAEEDKRTFYRKTIEAATEGKLIICERDDIDKISGPLLGACKISCAEDVGAARRVVAEIAESRGMDEERMFDLALCVGEAATNALKHAKRGMVSVHMRDHALLVLVTDNGPGMQAINLPDVALTRGYTTAVSMGMGYKAMISTADYVHLATGPDGTTVGIEMSLQPTTRLRTEISLPDTW